MPVQPERDALLVEYQKAQDSAEHHDNIVGSVTSLWLGSAVLIGFVLTAIGSKGAAHHKTVLILVSVLGILLTLLVTKWVWTASNVKSQKYARCKEIESALGMEQHTRLGPGRWFEPPAFYGLMAVFVAIWAVLLFDVASL